MSFGIGIGDIALVTRSAWRLYKACKESSDEFSRLSGDLMSLHAVLCETQDFMCENSQNIDVSRRYRLSMLCDSCRSVLDELDVIVTRYESLSTQAQRTWDRVHFGMKDLSDIRNRLVTSVSLLTAFYSAMQRCVCLFFF